MTSALTRISCPLRLHCKSRNIRRRRRSVRMNCTVSGYKIYDKIEDAENLLIAARAKKMAIEAEKLTGDNVCKVLIYYDKLYSVMDERSGDNLLRH